MKSPIELGEMVYLTPRTIGAPTIAWKQPRGTVTRRGEVMLTVKLDSGETVDIHEDNVVRRLPNPPKSKPAKVTLRPQLEGAEEVPLW